MKPAPNMSLSPWIAGIVTALMVVAVLALIHGLIAQILPPYAVPTLMLLIALLLSAIFQLLGHTSAGPFTLLIMAWRAPQAPPSPCQAPGCDCQRSTRQPADRI